MSKEFEDFQQKIANIMQNDNNMNNLANSAVANLHIVNLGLLTFWDYKHESVDMIRFKYPLTFKSFDAEHQVVAYKVDLVDNRARILFIDSEGKEADSDQFPVLFLVQVIGGLLAVLPNDILGKITREINEHLQKMFSHNNGCGCSNGEEDHKCGCKDDTCN